MALTSSIQGAFQLALTGSPDLGSSYWEFTRNWAISLTDGSSLYMANKVYQDSTTLAGSAATTVDLDSTLTDPLGNSISFTRIVAILARRTNTMVASTQDEDVKIHGDFIISKLMGGWVDDVIWIPLCPNGLFIYVAPGTTGVAVTASTGDQITFTNASSADSTTVEFVIVGS